MADDTAPLVLAAGLAGGIGVLNGGRHANIPVLTEHPSILGGELAPAEIGLIMSGMLFLSVVFTIGLFLTGFWWAGRANVPAAYGRFSGLLFGAAVVGVGVGYAILLFLVSSGHLPTGVLPTKGGIARATAGLVWAPFVGLAGGTLARYRSTTADSSHRRPASGNTPRYSLAIAVAGLSGVLSGLGSNVSLVAPLLVTDPPLLGTEFTASEASRILDVIGGVLEVSSFIATLGVFVAGYRWAVQADVPAAYGRFAVGLFIAALIGQAVGFIPLRFLLFEQPIASAIGIFVILTIPLLSVPVSGLAGGAMAQYRHTTDRP